MTEPTLKITLPKATRAGIEEAYPSDDEAAMFREMADNIQRADPVLAMQMRLEAARIDKNK